MYNYLTRIYGFYEIKTMFLVTNEVLSHNNQQIFPFTETHLKNAFVGH